MHRLPTDPDHALHRVLVQECIDYLQQHEISTIAIRGIRLLSLFVDEINKQLDTLAPNPLFAIDAKAGIRSKPAFTRMFTAAALADMITRLSDKYNDDTAPLSTLAMNGQQASTAPYLDPSIYFSSTAEMFPPQTGMSNSFVFLELLGYDQI